MKSENITRLVSTLTAIAMAVGLMLPLPALADLSDGGDASVPGAAQGLLAVEADHGTVLESQSGDTGKQAGVPVSGDTLDGVKIRFRPAGSHKPVSINDDGGGSQNVAHLYYNGKSSQFQLRKAGNDSYYFYFYQHYKNAEPKTSGDCVLDVERTNNDDSYMKEGQVIHVTGAGTATNKQWRLIPQADGTYYIQNVRSGIYMSLQDLTKPKENDNKLVQRVSPFAWEIEIVSYDNNRLKTIKEYDSYNFAYGDKTVTSLNWMGALSDTLKITDISIPGTHDVGTCNLDKDQDSMSDQRYYIDELLNAGVRHLDVRTGLNGSIVRIVHNGSHCRNRQGNDLTLDEALGWINSFLEANPTETIVLQIKMDTGGSDCERLTFDRLQREAQNSEGRIWAGNHVPTLGEARGKIVIISRLNPGSFKGDSFTITRDGESVQWALDCHDWKDSKDRATALTAQGSDYEVWTQDNWNHDASAKKPYIKAALLGNTADGYTNSTLARCEQAKMVGKDAWVFNYTSCSASPATPFKNSKEIHQWLYDRSDYGNSERLVCGDTFTGVMAFDFIDGLMAKHIYKTNFNRSYFTIHGINVGGKEDADPLTIYVGESGSTSAKFSSETTKQIIKAHFNKEPYIVATASDGSFLTETKVTSEDALASATATCNTDIKNGNVPSDLYVFLKAPVECTGEHSWNEGTETVQATCTAPGVKTFACERCGKTKTEPIPIDSSAHVTYTEEDATSDSATCEEGGRQTQYEICSLCGEVVKTKRIGTPARGHSWGETSYAWSDDKSTATATHICSRCGEQESETVLATTRVREESDCETAGLAVFDADFKNEDFGMQEITAEIPALGHDWGETSYVWADDNATVTAKRICKHDATHVQVEEAPTTCTVTETATCRTQGQAVYTAAFENEAFAEQSKTVAVAVEPDGHDWDTPTYTWSKDNGTVIAMRTCKNDATHVETEIAETTSVVTKPATCEAKGETTYTATFENEAFEEQAKTVGDVDALGHDWGETAYGWAADNSTVIAMRTCKNDVSHMQVEVASTTSKVTKAATATKKGQTIYTATFKNSAFAKQSKTVANIPATGPVPVTLAKAVAKGKTKLKLSWNKVTGAGRYLVYFAPCNVNGKTYKLKKIKTLSAGKTSLVKSGLKANTAYRMKVVAQAKSNGTWKTISKSKEAHAITANKKGKYTNASALTLNKTRLTLKVGKSAKLSGKVRKAIEGEKMTAALHAKLLRFATSDKSVATVSAAGKVTAKNPGTCKIYVQTPNGLWKSCKVTVK